MMERLWKEGGGGFAMIRLSDNVESRRGRLKVLLLFSEWRRVFRAASSSSNKSFEISVSRDIS